MREEELKRLTGMDPATFWKLLDQLVKAGFKERSGMSVAALALLYLMKIRSGMSNRYLKEQVHQKLDLSIVFSFLECWPFCFSKVVILSFDAFGAVGSTILTLEIQFQKCGANQV